MRSFFALAIGLALPACSVGAIVTFTDRTTFLSSTGASAATAFPNSGNVASPFALGTLTYSLAGGSTQLVSGTGDATQWSTLFPGHELALSGTEDLDVVLSSPLFSFGFDFHEPSAGTPPGTSTDACGVASCVDSTFTITLFNGVTNVGSFNVNAPNDVAAFVGVWSDAAFNRVTIREVTGTNDNEFFAQFYSGATPLANNAIPEPGTLLLVSAGIILLASRSAFARR